MKSYKIKKISFYIFTFFVFAKISAQSVFYPNSISGLKLWLTGDSCKSTVLPYIDTVYDLSVNQNHANQQTNSLKPKLSNNLLNGHQTILFDGLDQFIAFNNIHDIRTVFWVLKENALVVGNNRPFLGHSSLYDFHRGFGNIIFSSANANTLVTSGQTQLNSVAVNPIIQSLPNNFNLVSLITTGNVNAEYFSKDRANTGRAWDGELAELIIYNQPLNSSEIAQVEQYFYDKYSPPIQLPLDITTNLFCDTIIRPINPNNNQYAYQWSTGATTPTISTKKSGKYWVTATNLFGKISSDTIIVNYPHIVMKNDSTFCNGNNLLWNTQLSKSNFTFQWQDNSTDSLFNINQTGNYYVKITDSFGCSITSDTAHIAIDNFPTTTTLGADVSLCAGNAIALQTNTTSITTYTWNDGSHQPNLVINTSGQYFVAVTNTNNCIAKDTIQITVLGQAPSVNFNASVGCRNSAVSFTNLALAPVGNTITSVLWNFGNTTSSTNTTNISNPTHIYADTGMYVVSLTINTDVGCSNNTSQTIHIAPTPTVIFINGISCQNDSTAFASIITSPTYSIISKQWTFGDIASGAANTSTLSNPKHLFSNQTNYTTRLVATNTAGCKDSVTKVIAVKAQVKADFNYTSACTGSLMKFTDNSIVPAPNTSNVRQWNFATSTATGTLINQFYSIAAVYPVTLTVIGNNGCVSSAVKQITVTIPPTCNFSTLSSFCVSDSVLLLDASAGSSPIQQWNWIANSNLYSTLPSVYFKNATSGTQIIKLKVTDTKGCKDSLSKSVTIYALPNSNFTITPNDVFANSTITLTPHTATYSTYSWLGSNGFSYSLPTPVYTFADTGKYDFYLQVLDANGCKNTAQQSLQINNKRTDLGVLELMPSLQPTGYLGLTAQLGNLGTAPINQFKLKITLQNSSQIQETWLGNLNKGTLLNYEVTELLTNDASKNGIVCATITEVNNEPVDDNLNNNYLCTEISPNGTAIYEPYPNPSADVITFPIAVKNDVSVLIEITNTLGELVIAEQKSTTQGLNFETLSVYGLAKGAYFAKITIDDKIFVKKIMSR